VKNSGGFVVQGVHNYIHEKGKAAAALTEDQKQANTRKSKTRARVEHTCRSLTPSAQAEREWFLIT
jgi:hypothetical protein